MRYHGKLLGGASGYEIYSSSNGSDYVKSAKVGGSQKSAIVSGFEPYSLRMVKVRAYKTVNGKTSYGAFFAGGYGYCQVGWIQKHMI